MDAYPQSSVPKDLSANQSNERLCRLIAQHILAAPQQRIPFAAFMELALYAPEGGYYATKAGIFGATGDFVTSPFLAADFGELLAEQFFEMWVAIGQPEPFTLVEMGAGQGLVVQDVLRYLHRHHFDCFAALEYWIIESSPALVAKQKQHLQNLANSWGHLHWYTWEQIAPASIVGCCFSNELVDAFPVHRVAIAQNQLQEVYVTLADASDSSPSASAPLPQFQDVWGDLSTPALRDYFDLVGINLLDGSYPDGYTTEVNLAALDWMATVANRLQRGYVLTIDYGYPAQRYYSPRRSEGTLQCYFQHAHHNDPYRHIGQQDITAHVDFTALERQGERCGLETLGFVQQGLWLMALGLGDRIAALSHQQADSPQAVQRVLQRREALHALMNPMGLGNFGVLVQGKGLTETGRSLRGLQLPALSVLSQPF